MAFVIKQKTANGLIDIDIAAKYDSDGNEISAHYATKEELAGGGTTVVGGNIYAGTQVPYDTCQTTTAETYTGNTFHKGDLYLNTSSRDLFKCFNVTANNSNWNRIFRIPQGFYYGTQITGTANQPARDTASNRWFIATDLYLNTSTGVLYECSSVTMPSSSTWAVVCNLKGDTGGGGSTWYTQWATLDDYTGFSVYRLDYEALKTIKCIKIYSTDPCYNSISLSPEVSRNPTDAEYFSSVELNVEYKAPTDNDPTEYLYLIGTGRRVTDSGDFKDSYLEGEEASDLIFEIGINPVTPEIPVKVHIDSYAE